MRNSSKNLIHFECRLDERQPIMADVVEQVVNATLNATLNATAENATDTSSGKKIPATPEGAAVAYGSLVVMAMLPIFFGAIRSVKHQKDQKVIPGEKNSFTNSVDSYVCVCVYVVGSRNETCTCVVANFH